MKLAKVIGTVVATIKHENLEKYKILMIAPLDENLSPKGSPIAVIDTVGAGPGEIVYFTLSRESTFALDNPNTAIDGAITGIVDQVNKEI